MATTKRPAFYDRYKKKNEVVVDVVLDLKSFIKKIKCVTKAFKDLGNQLEKIENKQKGGVNEKEAL